MKLEDFSLSAPGGNLDHQEGYINKVKLNSVHRIGEVTSRLMVRLQKCKQRTGKHTYELKSVQKCQQHMVTCCCNHGGSLTVSNDNQVFQDRGC